jgi:hypothetical protein
MSAITNIRTGDHQNMRPVTYTLTLSHIQGIQYTIIGSNNLGDPRLDGRIILKWILKKWYTEHGLD